MKYDSIIKKYQGLPVSYRGVREEIKYIVLCIIQGLQVDDLKKVDYCCSTFKSFNFIKSIGVSHNYCELEFYDGDLLKRLEFKCYYFGDSYKEMLYTDRDVLLNSDLLPLKGKYRFSEECHYATLYYLDTFRKSNIKAITSLCVSNKGESFFHSYIWDVSNGVVIDLARNIIMSKDSFDYLFVLEEINVFDYYEYSACKGKFDFNGYYELLVMALDKLESKNGKRLVY